jgi:hypothetical protein
MSKTGQTKRYYPTFKSLLFGPVAIALLIGLPFVTKPQNVVAGLGITIVVLLLTLLAWRRVFRVEVSDGLISGRNPETATATQLELSTIVAIREAQFAIGRIKGWSLANDRGDAVFVSEGVLADPAIRAVVESQGTG